MADFIRKKLQVFVSSTFTDLLKERQAAVEAILTAGHIPAGMELFTAGDESQMQVIKQWIDESDVYVLILGGRYGSVESTTGKSYTQLEYEYALSKEKPLFACVIKDEAIDAKVKARGRSVIEQEQPQKLKEFRAAVLTKMCKFWEDTKDIKIVITETLSHLARSEDLIGWVRADSQSDLPALADEIARLSKENSQLRDRLARVSQDETINGLTYSELRHVLGNAFERLLEFRDRLGQGDLLKTSPPANPLIQRGLLTRDSNGFLDLTEAGRTFLNMHDIAELRAETESQVSDSKRKTRKTLAKQKG